jgi:hypothetical protein
MPKSGAERQKLYRSKRHQGEGENRLNTWVSSSAHHALARLAARYGVTRRTVLERLIVAEDDKVLKTLDLDTEDWERYFNRERNTADG